MFPRACLLVLGLFVVLGLSLSVVQASGMAARMGMADMAGCDGCKDMPGNAKATSCGAACVALAAATVPEFPALLIERPLARYATLCAVVAPWSASPNPHPPRLAADT
jgi:hypothetical protein